VKRLAQFIWLRLFPRKCSYCTGLATRRDPYGELICEPHAVELAVALVERMPGVRDRMDVPKGRR
jgi:hypothetical protein